MRVCLDANVLVAAFATRGLCADILRMVLAEHELVTGKVIMTEFEQSLRRKLKLPDEQLRAAMTVFAGVAEVPDPKEPSTLQVRDPSDRLIIASALAEEAEVLVTGDDDLLSIASASPLPSMSPRSFWESTHKGTP